VTNMFYKIVTRARNGDIISFGRVPWKKLLSDLIGKAFDNGIRLGRTQGYWKYKCISIN